MLATPMTPTKRDAGLLVATILSGCAVGPDYVAPKTEFTAFHDPMRHTPTAPAPQLDRWWTGFNGPVLVTIVQRVLDQNLDPTAALARVEQAKEAASAAGAELLPVDLDASATAERQSVESPLGSLAGSLPGYNRDQRECRLELAASWEIARIFRPDPVSEASNRLSSLNRQEHTALANNALICTYWSCTGEKDAKTRSSTNHQRNRTMTHSQDAVLPAFTEHRVQHADVARMVLAGEWS